MGRAAPGLAGCFGDLTGLGCPAETPCGLFGPVVTCFGGDLASTWDGVKTLWLATAVLGWLCLRLLPLEAPSWRKLLPRGGVTESRPGRASSGAAAPAHGCTEADMAVGGVLTGLAGLSAGVLHLIVSSASMRCTRPFTPRDAAATVSALLGDSCLSASWLHSALQCGDGLSLTGDLGSARDGLKTSCSSAGTSLMPVAPVAGSLACVLPPLLPVGVVAPFTDTGMGTAQSASGISSPAIAVWRLLDEAFIEPVRAQEAVVIGSVHPAAKAEEESDS